MLHLNFVWLIGPIVTNFSNGCLWLSGAGGGVPGVHAHPQKVRFVKIMGKIPQNLGKIPENLGKYPWKSEQNPQIPTPILWKPGQKCPPTFFDLKKWRPTFAEKHVKNHFLDVTQKTVGKSCTTTSWASLGKFGQKSFAAQKVCLLLHLRLNGHVRGDWCAVVLVDLCAFHFRVCLSYTVPLRQLDNCWSATFVW